MRGFSIYFPLILSSYADSITVQARWAFLSPGYSVWYVRDAEFSYFLVLLQVSASRWWKSFTNTIFSSAVLISSQMRKFDRGSKHTLIGPPILSSMFLESS